MRFDAAPCGMEAIPYAVVQGGGGGYDTSCFPGLPGERYPGESFTPSPLSVALAARLLAQTVVHSPPLSKGGQGGSEESARRRPILDRRCLLRIARQRANRLPERIARDVKRYVPERDRGMVSSGPNPRPPLCKGGRQNGAPRARAPTLTARPVWGLRFITPP